MEPILTNTCEYNEVNLTEAMRVQLRQLQRKKNLLFYVLIGALLLFSLYTWLFGKQTQYAAYAALSVLMFAMLIFTNRSLPGRTARLQVARILEKNGSLRFQTRFREDGLAMISPAGSENSLVPYSELSGLTETEHLILLFTDKKQLILLDREGFGSGSAADLFALARARFPQVLPKTQTPIPRQKEGSS